jgi:hypothetical protein
MPEMNLVFKLWACLLRKINVDFIFTNQSNKKKSAVVG